MPPRTRTTTEPEQRVGLHPAQVQALIAHLNPNRIARRNMGGKSMSYVEAYDIRAALIKIFGFGGWSLEVDSKILDIRDDGRQGVHTSGEKQGQTKTPYVMAHAKVRIIVYGIGPQGQDVHYDGSAIGTNDGFTIGDVADNAIKSAESDALKRAAINLGTQFGLSLYNNGSNMDIIRTVLQPEQSVIIEDFRSAVESEQQQKAQAFIDRATSVPTPVVPEEPSGAPE